MTAPTPRMAQLQAMLAAEPNDPELRYFLAMEYHSIGDELTATAKLCELTQDSTYVPAFLMAAQILARAAQTTEACAILHKGITAARQQGNAHAEGEMQALLDSLE